jgi:membrane protease YdiL (CAAX protease family)
MFGILVLLWLPLGVPILLWVQDPNWQSILGLGSAYLGLVAVMYAWGKGVAQRPSPLGYYGLQWSTLPNPWSRGLALGLAVVLGIYVLQSLLGWITWRTPSPQFALIFLEGFAVSAGVGFAEELFFRGWLFTELEADYGQRRAVMISSLLFATLHFIKPWADILKTLPQFPGLLLLGLILANAKRRHLGQSMGIHSGLVWGYYLIQVGNVVRDNPEVSPWFTGVIPHNPLSGLLGIVGLGLWWWIVRDK